VYYPQNVKEIKGTMGYGSHEPPQADSGMSKEPSLQDRFIGTILGVAVGDALGAPVEGWSRKTIKTVLGTVRGYQLTMMGKGIFTDETQLTLVLLKSLLHCRKFAPEDFGNRIGEWMRLSDEGIEPARGVGRTISLAARKLYRGIPWDQSGEYSASNGAAVRIAPLTLLNYDTDGISEFMQDVENSAKPTHIESLAIQGAKVIALAQYLVLKEDRFFFDRIEFIDNLIKLAGEHAPKMVGSIAQLKKYIGRKPIEHKVYDKPCSKNVFSRGQSIEDTDDRYAILEEIGTGKYVLESVPAALYCFLNSPSSFEETLLTAVNAGGDTDSIAALAGSLSGALNGAPAIPMRWLMDLENREEMIELSIQLHEQAIGLDLPEGVIYISRTKIQFKS
jgi:ADP-ribosylglycohydrolase